MVFWLLGSLAGATGAQAAVAAGLIFAGTVVLIVLSWRINLLSLGDEEARSLGVRTEAVKAAVVASVTVMTAAAVAVYGIIGWVGLVIPHATRMLVGPDHRRLLPASFALGASYLMLIDDLSRTISTQEIPIGILTALIGAPACWAWCSKNTPRPSPSPCWTWSGWAGHRTCASSPHHRRRTPGSPRPSWPDSG